MGYKIHDKRDKTYIVVGPPRSGTSLLSKALQDQNINMGDDKTSDSLEDKDFTELNDWIIERAGGTWLEPPPQNKIDRLKKDSVVTKRIKALLKKKKIEFWGVKDPRFTLTLSLYLPHLSDDRYLICIFRKTERHRKHHNSFSLLNRYQQNLIKIIKEFIFIPTDFYKQKRKKITWREMRRQRKRIKSLDPKYIITEKGHTWKYNIKGIRFYK